MASWAEHAISELSEGREVIVRPSGNSMAPLIKSRQEVRLRPLRKGEVLKRGMIVLVAMSTRTIYLHKISALAKDRVQISNNRGRINGWTSRANIHGVAVLR